VHWLEQVGEKNQSLIVVLNNETGGAILNAGSSAIMSWFPEHRHGLVLGVFFFAYGIGPPVLGSYSAAFATWLTLFWLFVLQACLCVLAGVLCALFVRDSPFLQLRKQLKDLDDSAIEAICRTRFQQDFFPAIEEKSRWSALTSAKCWILSMVTEKTKKKKKERTKQISCL
jgi:MFS family permease